MWIHRELEQRTIENVMSSSDPSESPALPEFAKRIRLQRYLAACGIGSRRACEELITAGRVTVDGRVASELGTQIDPQKNKIALDGEKLRMERKKYYVFNKPPGILCTNRDPQGRPRVIDFFPKEGPRLFTVGRLDEDSEGLLIVTNDGDLAQKIAHPSYRIFRTYHVLVAGQPTPETLLGLRKGVYFEEGRFRVEGVKSIKRQGQSTWCEVVLAEGHNREVRRLFARVGHKVMKLQRVAFGPIFLGKMTRGEIRELRRDELERLFGMLQKNTEAPSADNDLTTKRTGTTSKSKKRNDGDVLNRSSRKVPMERRTAPPKRSAPSWPIGDRVKRAGDRPTRPDPSDRAHSRGPKKSEPRGLGLRDVPDEELMGFRPAKRSRHEQPAEQPGTKHQRTSTRPTSNERKSPRTAPSGQKTQQHKRRPDEPRESTGRRSPGQPKPKGPRRNPRGR